ncbi:hypothetical protein EVAR_49471_1 [Eumeta japonica]|uniref:Uncharacterized protein n=1 Tax=Eumeta variegata TaxID=151549 RepID=A0A4C1Y2Y6_EUMVA|nr:hypothetical protein EVAR_49471_1 [Eumeta japonica]
MSVKRSEEMRDRESENQSEEDDSRTRRHRKVGVGAEAASGSTQAPIMPVLAPAVDLQHVLPTRERFVSTTKS